MAVPKQVIENGAISHFNLTYADLYRLYTWRTLQTIYCCLKLLGILRCIFRGARRPPDNNFIKVDCKIEMRLSLTTNLNLKSKI